MRTAYRQLAGLLHPDRHVDESAAERALADRRMREVNRAWQILGDDTARAQYDRELSEDRERARRISAADRANRQAAAGRPPAAPPGATPPDHDDDDDLIDVMPPPGTLAEMAVRSLPWIVLLGVLLVIFLVTAYATAGKNDRSSTTGGAGTPTSVAPCVTVLAGPATSVVDCTRPNDGRVVARVASPSSCPAGSDPRRLSQDGLWDCLEK